jgi:methyl-accepting chemotaxis protein
MDKVTQQNAAMVEETTAAAQSLTHETESLAELLRRFRTSSGRASEHRHYALAS